MEIYANRFPIEKMAEVLEVSRSGYYQYLSRPSSKRRLEALMYKGMIKAIFEKHKGRYGANRISINLRSEGYCISRQRVGKFMKQLGLAARKKRKKTYAKPKNQTIKVPNELMQCFNVNTPDQVWVSDITYLYYHGRRAYLTIVMDLFNREPVGWHLSRSLHAESTVIPALQKGISCYHPEPGLLFHSDQGSQYHDLNLRKYINERQIRQSMSGKGNCYDNAVAESFFSTLKCELREYREAVTFDELYCMMFEYIEGYYKNMRIHSYLNWMTPYEYRRTYYEK